jgi:hypothetical protein
MFYSSPYNTGAKRYTDNPMIQEHNNKNRNSFMIVNEFCMRKN